LLRAVQDIWWRNSAGMFDFRRILTMLIKTAANTGGGNAGFIESTD
jgi:hypothetical protein